MDAICDHLTLSPLNVVAQKHTTIVTSPKIQQGDNVKNKHQYTFPYV